MIEEDLVALLRTSAPSAQQRVRPTKLAQNSLLPALVYRRVSGPREKSHSGSSHLAHPRFTIECWGADYPSAKRLATEVIALDGFRGVVGGSRIDKFDVANDIDDYDEDTDRHRILVDVIIWHQE